MTVLTGEKPALASTAVWGSIVAIIAGAAPLIGYSISTDDQAAMANLIQNGVAVVSAVASLIGGAVALYGRIKATKQISGVLTAH